MSSGGSAPSAGQPLLASGSFIRTHRSFNSSRAPYTLLPQRLRTKSPASLPIRMTRWSGIRWRERVLEGVFRSGEERREDREGSGKARVRGDELLRYVCPSTHRGTARVFLHSSCTPILCFQTAGRLPRHRHRSQKDVVLLCLRYSGLHISYLSVLRLPPTVHYAWKACWCESFDAATEQFRSWSGRTRLCEPVCSESRSLRLQSRRRSLRLESRLRSSPAKSKREGGRKRGGVYFA
ncbi:hypothetical protein C8R44DRAFT_240135 [Mycena epipterygia]|nr:hypothetical protein C8R44DRAFT_240135 [Mycena epipterygia]